MCPNILYFVSLNIDVASTNSADPDKMLHYVAFSGTSLIAKVLVLGFLV